MGAVPLDPTCDVCGTTKRYRQGIGSFCPNINCGGTETPESLVDDSPPPAGKFVKLSSKSVMIALEEKLRAEQPMLDKIETVDLFGVLLDGTQRKLTNVMLQVSYPKADKRPGPVRQTAPCELHPKGVQIKLASRDGVAL